VLRRTVTPLPPVVDGVSTETFGGAVESFVWIVFRRPGMYVPLLSGVVLASFAYAVMLVPGPVWAPAVIAFAMAVVALAGGLAVQWARRRRRVHASPDARLAILARRRGWYVADHVARPGVRGAGRRLRLQVAPVLISQADAADVVVYAHTTSETLAEAYLADIPGLRIAGRRGRRILLVRPPRRHLR